MKEVINGWSKLHDKELLNVYSSEDIVMVMKSRSIGSMHSEIRNKYKIVV
jgi:hypothetical protein